METGDFLFDLPKQRSSAIKVIGVGGGGSNAVNYMYQQGIEGVDFAVCNTDAQALNHSPVPNRIQLGKTITEGLGAGANPEVGEQAALESVDDIKRFLDSNTKMAFITAGMGGGTGTGAAPVIAEISKEMGILTVGIVTAPFFFEGKMRLAQAEEGITKMQKNVDSLIVINNDKLRELYGNLGYKASFAKADEILTTAAKGIAEVISKQYAMNIDLRDARTVLADSGTAIMGTATASGENKATEAITSALDSPLLNNNKISGARNVLLLIVSGDNEVTMDEIAKINEYIQVEAKNNANIIMGVGEDPDLGEKISVTVIATGFPKEDQVFTGKEEEKIFHTLEDEQPIVKKLSAEAPFPIHQKKNFEENFEEEAKDNKETKATQEVEERIVFTLEDETEENKKKPIEESLNAQEQIGEEEEIIFEFKEIEAKEDFQNQEEKSVFEEKPQTIRFTLDDDFEEEKLDLKEEASHQVQIVEQTIVDEKNEETEDPFDSPISESLSQAIEERRARLKQFNYKFKNTLSQKTVDEIEGTPAYKRQGIELEGHERKTPSDFIVSENDENELKIRPNNFLHDNVD